MNHQNILFIAIPTLLFIFLMLKLCFKLQQKSIERIILLISLPLIIGYIGNVYYYGLSMHKRALQSTSQINGCGWLEQKISFNYHKGRSEQAYKVRTENWQFIEFNGDTKSHERLPLLNQLKLRDAVCFRYAQNVQDQYKRYLLTDLQLNPKPPTY